MNKDNSCSSGNISFSDPRFNYSYKGFCSIVTGAIDMAVEHYLDNNNFNVTINDDQILNLFDNVFFSDNNLYELGPLWLEKFFSNEIYQREYNAHTPANLENLKFKNKVYNNILKIKKEYIEKFEKKVSQFGIDENTLAIHIRGTDKKNELPEIDIKTVFNLIDEKIKDKIFVSTDDKKYLDLLLERYGDLVVYDHTIQISNDSSPLHCTTNNRQKINEEVLSNVYLLSKCNYFLYCFSNVSLLALIMGVHNFKFIDYINK